MSKFSNWWNNKFKPWWKDKVADNFRIETRDNSEGMGRFLNGVDNLWNRITGSGLTNAEREANKYSAAQAEEQYNREVEFYEKYQSPKAMLQQGINPFSINGSAGGHTASGGSPTSVAPQGAEGLSGLMGLVQSIFGMQQQKRMNDAEISFMGAQERNQNSQAFLNEIDALTRDDVNKATFANIIKLGQKYDVEISSLEEGIQASIQSRMESLARIDLMKIEGDERKQHIENMKQELANMVLEAFNIQADTDFKRASIDQIGAYINNLNVDSAYKEELMILVSNQALTELYKQGEISANIEHLNGITSAATYQMELEEAVRDTMKNRGRGYDKARFIMSSLMGWFSGNVGAVGTVDLKRSPRPKKIGFK